MHWLHVMTLSALGVLVASAEGQERVANVVLGIHGGTGRDKKDVDAKLNQELRATLELSLKAGYQRLQKPGATSLDGVEAAIRLLEDSPLFNAGKGAVFTHQGRNELDASIMEGKSLRAGAVAGVTRIKNPITAARAVMEKTKHVMLVGEGADAFGKEIGLEIIDPSYFRTEERWQQLQKAIEEEKKQNKQTAVPRWAHEWSTVGAVAIDAAGVLAAGTSTGGMTNKRFGRVGDSPIIGAGTYADNQSCAVSCTGHGEYFIRHAVSHSISVLMKYKGLSVKQAAEEVVNKTLKDAGGEGGVIALDANKNFAMSYNTEGLYRGYITGDGKIKVMLYED
jgi:beta-aspartyl-peptidase (threonine type)